MTWERFLVLWGLIAPAIGAAFAHWWAAKQVRDNRAFEQSQWKRQVDLEESRRHRDEERQLSTDLQARMEKAYAQFLSSGMRLVTLPRTTFDNPEKQQAIAEFSAGYQQLLLVASSACATQAVALWKKTLNSVNAPYTEEARAQIDIEIRALRAEFVREARTDLANPIERNANPGITIQPALKIGGFNLDDVG